MKKVTGIGGIFFKSSDPKKTKRWYHEYLGIESGEHGGGFRWRSEQDPQKAGFTVWSVFDNESDYFDPSIQSFMINYIVEDLDSLMKNLKSEGIEIAGDIQVYSYGKFAWIIDPDGNKIELWEPIGKEL